LQTSVEAGDVEEADEVPALLNVGERTTDGSNDDVELGVATSIELGASEDWLVDKEMITLDKDGIEEGNDVTLTEKTSVVLEIEMSDGSEEAEDELRDTGVCDKAGDTTSVVDETEVESLTLELRIGVDESEILDKIDDLERGAVDDFDDDTALQSPNPG
jgi:hypothetical protein